MSSNVLFTIFTTLVPYLLTSQCLINNMTLIKTDCDISGKFYVEINFDHSGSGTHFRLAGNGNNYGTYSYTDLPVTVGPLNADCSTIWEFAVRDVQNTNCLAFKGLGKICCNTECTLAFTEIMGTNCNGTHYNLSFDLQHNQPPTSKFRLSSNNNFIGEYQYGQLPLTLNNVTSSGFETFNRIVVCASDNISCCDTFMLLNPCICSIYDYRVQVIDCVEEDSTFGIKLNFKYNLTSDSFIIGGNITNYGKFAYSDLPVHLSGLNMDSIKDYEFLVVDAADAFCFNSYELGVVDSCNFECQVNAIINSISECQNGLFYTDIKLNASQYGFSGFGVSGPDVFQIIPDGVTSFNIGPLNALCEADLNIRIFDIENELCYTEISLQGPYCCQPDTCKITSIHITEDCENNDILGFELFIDFRGATSDSFVLTANSIKIGEYSYTEIPVRITEFGFGLPDVVFTVTDLKENECRLDSSYTFNCYPIEQCRINNFEIINSYCTDEQLYLEFTFQKEATSLAFVLLINDIITDTFNYADQIFSIGPLDTDCGNLLELKIADLLDSTCNARLEYLNADCCKTCVIGSNLKFESGECKDGKFDIDINFGYINASDSFYIWMDNQLLNIHAYTDLPIRISDLDGMRTYAIDVKDFMKECNFSSEITNNECLSGTGDVIIKYFDFRIQGNILSIEYAHMSQSPYLMQIYDLTGRILESFWINTQDFQYELSKIPSGMMIISIRSEYGRFNHKFVHMSR